MRDRKSSSSTTTTSSRKQPISLVSTTNVITSKKQKLSNHKINEIVIENEIIDIIDNSPINPVLKSNTRTGKIVVKSSHTDIKSNESTSPFSIEKIPINSKSATKKLSTKKVASNLKIIDDNDEEEFIELVNKSRKLHNNLTSLSKEDSISNSGPFSTSNSIATEAVKEIVQVDNDIQEVTKVKEIKNKRMKQNELIEPISIETPIKISSTTITPSNQTDEANKLSTNSLYGTITNGPHKNEYFNFSQYEIIGRKELTETEKLNEKNKYYSLYKDDQISEK